jgi:subtilisin family serine protease
MKKILAMGMGMALLAGGAGSAVAGVVMPDLAEFLNEAEAEEYVPFIVHLDETLDLRQLREGFTENGVTLDRRARHEIAVRALQRRAEHSQGRIRALLHRRQEEGTVESYQPFWIANAVAVTALPEVINEIAMLPGVREISYDTQLELVEPVDQTPAKDVSAMGAESGLREINAPPVWAMGYTGEGVLVSHLDTGVDGSHPAFAARWRGLEPGVTPGEAFFDPVTHWTFPQDSGYHGTHTMGTICGVTPGDTIGVAFNATWISAAVIDRISLERTESDAILAFQWTADPDGDPGTVDDVPVVSSNSWGFSPIYHGVPYCNDVFWASMDGAEAAGVAVVFAAGNEGSGSKTLRTPADRITTDVNAFSVGALSPGSTSIAYFSSRGPSGCDNVTIKPEVSARGEDVRSAYPGGGYTNLSGTSMAAPHVAGAVALLNDVNPDILPERAKQILMETAVDLGSAGEDNTYGWGRIDVAAAAMQVRNEMGGIFGVVSGEGTPLEGAWVQEVVSGIGTATAQDGTYRLGMSPGQVYTVRASAYGYEDAETVVDIPQQEFIEVNFDLVLAVQGTLAGTVTDSETGEVLSGVKVEILGTPVAPVYTAGDGSYSIDVAGGAAYDVEFSATGYQQMLFNDVFVAGNQVTTLDAALDPFPTIFVWNPDPTPISGTFIHDYFVSRGEDVLVSDQLNAYGDLTKFEKIFVCLGMFNDNYQIAPNGTEDQALVDYLSAGGGRLLYIEGGDFWAYDPATQVRGYFKIDGLADGTSDLTRVNGMGGTPTQGKSFLYQGENSYVDRLAPTGGSKSLWENANTGSIIGVLNTTSPSYVTVGQSFEIGGLRSAAAAAFMDRLLEATE